MKRFEHIAVIEKPVHDVYALAQQVERYPEFLPGYLESKIVGQKEDAIVLQRKALVRGRVHAWQSHVRFEKDASIHFQHAAGPLKGMNVKWLFTPLSEKQTRLSIVHLFSLTRRGWWRRMLVSLWLAPRVEKMAEQVIHAFKNACEDSRWEQS